jgi:homoserine dehydrogenase
MCRKFLVLISILLAQQLYAKRIEPQPVSPVESNGLEYSADGDGRVQYVTATDVATSQQLWKVKIFQTHIKPWIEEDIQWVFITNLTLNGETLVIRD